MKVNLIEKDENGFYIHADNYAHCKSALMIELLIRQGMGEQVQETYKASQNHKCLRTPTVTNVPSAPVWVTRMIHWLSR